MLVAKYCLLETTDIGGSPQSLVRFKSHKTITLPVKITNTPKRKDTRATPVARASLMSTKAVYLYQKSAHVVV
jgi:hypothetical protein